MKLSKAMQKHMNFIDNAIDTMDKADAKKAIKELVMSITDTHQSIINNYDDTLQTVYEAYMVTLNAYLELKNGDK